VDLNESARLAGDAIRCIVAEDENAR